MGAHADVDPGRPTLPTGHLRRAHLVDRVTATPAGGVCLLVSEPGYGRRTLVAEALGGSASVVRLPPTALSADGFIDLVSHTLGVEVRDAGAVVTAVEQLADPWLVLLDLSPELHPDAVRLLEHIAHARPARLRTVVVTQSALSGSLARLRLDGGVVEIDQSDLVLAREEAEQLLVAAAPGLDEADRREVVALCDGWVGALTAVARRHLERRDGDVVTWLRSHGAAQLVAPWLDAVPPDVHELLLDTSVLDRLAPDLVDQVTGRPCGVLLPDVARPHGMVRVLWHRAADDVLWYGRHPLLTAFLRFASAGRPGEVERHRRAAAWYGRQGDVGRELEHTLLTGDVEAAAEGFRRSESHLMETGQADLALRWYRSAPDAHPPAEQLLREAWGGALSGRTAEGSVALARLRMMMRQGEVAWLDTTVPRDLEAEADVLEAWYGEHDGDLVRTVVFAGHARARFGGAWSLTSHQLAALLHARALAVLDDMPAAASILAAVRAEPFAAAALSEGRRAVAEAEVAWSRGLVLEARAWAGRYERWLAEQVEPVGLLRFGPCHVSGLVLAEAGRTAEAVALLERAVAHAGEVTGNTTDLVLSRLALARVLADAGALPAAFAQVAAARSTVLERSPHGGLLPRVTRAEAGLRLAAGDGVRADRLIRTLSPGVARQILAARLALLRSTPGAAALVREIDPTTPREEVEVAILLAWALLGTSPQRSEQQLLRAADLAGQVGITQALAHAPEPLLELARRTAHHHVHDPLVSLVVAAERGRRSGGDTRAAHVPLTRGELQLLALLPSRAGNAAIATTLGVSVNTVKTRLRRLYSKLGVHGRDDAVARAKELGLVSGRGPAGG